MLREFKGTCSEVAPVKMKEGASAAYYNASLRCLDSICDKRWQWMSAHCSQEPKAADDSSQLA